MDFKHTSVLLEECLEGLHLRPDGIYVDGTMGGAGHSRAICERLSPEGTFIGIDQDENAIRAGKEKLDGMRNTVRIVRSNYREIKSVLEELDIPAVDGILLDLGVSSHQLDEASRGFTYMQDAPLDMRMDQRQEKTARTIVNEYPEEEIVRILFQFGEEKFARRIAARIVEQRGRKPLETTGELVEIIKASIPMKYQQMGGHPAKRTFQAIRIELNQELAVLEEALDQMVELLAPGGRLCIITFHSLEDRIVKNRFRNYENPCNCPPSLPLCVCNKKPLGRVLTRKPILPSPQEMEANARSKSAKLRIFERIGEQHEDGETHT
ncbi:16S rRNA (cytosine(1402)-N(4))-methyltransferase RsmH [Anaerotalea alkaliphila]|uniref:Ribosomal RNA small subunit methyltransferase H n=1 Tax=Anaerotalea alkaliphila TaxID=2662126 RepID=A0A7X5KMV0_9FIRM|nr:16S rRNA (cytosine(1402)-N(4))-methyltransferase RsmH [Anaerotalea alkaliphila]NDL66137.1 16S rRNA (cytosine(1402)-N(4))-methyltransferase RsmH [Anaerotalea alkaliphila]